LEDNARGIRVVGDLFARHVQEKPDAEAIVCNGQRIT
jgi:hypothetical protein